MGRSGPRRIAAVLTTLLLAGLAPAAPALAGIERSDAGGAATKTVNRSLDLKSVRVGGGYKLSGFAYKSNGSVLHLQLDNAPQVHSGDFRGEKGAVKISDSLRKVTIEMPFDGGFGKAMLSSKVPASAVNERKIEGCSGKKYSVEHELSGILKFKTGSDPFGTIKIRKIKAKLTATSANFQCQPVDPECPEVQRVMAVSGNDFVIDARKSKGKARVSLLMIDQVTPNTSLTHRVTAKVPGSAVQLADDLSSGSVDTTGTGAEPDLEGEFSFSATAAGTTSPGECGTTYHYRDGEFSGVGFHAEFDWGGSYYPFVGGPIMGGVRRIEVP
ncbi:MAG: hypothetical protein GEU71_00150 [Actinobacteria bacterium]|nr:hypothetical protein [Actinomycetota bacterium]